MIDYKPVNLFDLAAGAANDHFESGLRKVLEDIEDAGKKIDAPRSFDLRFKFECDEQGLSARITVQLLSVKLAPSRPAVTGAILDRTSGQLELREAQQEHFEMPDNVRQIKENDNE